MAKTRGLRPLGTADLLDETVELFKSNFALMVGISAVINLPMALINALVALHTPHKSPNFTPLLGAAAGPIVAGALIFGITDRHLGLTASIRSCYRRSLTESVYWPLLGVSIVQMLVFVMCMGVVMLLGMPSSSLLHAAGVAGGFSYVVNGLIFLGGVLATGPLWVRLMLAGPAAVLEKMGTGLALSRSWTLIRGSVFRSTFVVVIANVLVYVIPLIIYQAIRPLTGHRLYYDVPIVYRAIQQGIVVLINVVMSPLVAIAQALLYFDLRVRKEGFDLELLAGEMERT